MLFVYRCGPRRSQQERTIKFTPALSAEREEALAGMEAEACTKLVYVFHMCVWDDRWTHAARVGLVPRWVLAGQDARGVVVEGLAAAAAARALDALPLDEALAAGLEDLAVVLGVSSLTLKVRRFVWVLVFN